ncbi:type II toxin-antitoxin system RelE/ParE family toxin [bacterium]|nr:type II toxin-antitoxin system RelE/ParE family toxin [bacterium]
MNSEFRKSFSKDLKKRSQDKKLLSQVRGIIKEVEEAKGILEIKNIKKLQAEGHYYRIRLGDYRIGLLIKNDTVIFVRFLHRGEIYRYFP